MRSDTTANGSVRSTAIVANRSAVLRRRLEPLLEALRAGGARIVLTKGYGEGRDAVIGFPPCIRRVVAVGGDGTLNDVLGGIRNRLPALELGVVPAGTANDACKGLGLPPGVGDAMEVALRSGTAPFRPGLANGALPFAAHFDVGLAATVARVANVLKSAAGGVPLGALGYAPSLLAAVLSEPPFRACVEIHEPEAAMVPRLRQFGFRPAGKGRFACGPERFLTGIFSCVRRVGGLFHLSPRPVPQNRILLCIARNPRARRRFLAALHAFHGSLHAVPDILLGAVAGVEIEFQGAMEFAADSEIVGSGAALRVERAERPVFIAGLRI